MLASGVVRWPHVMAHAWGCKDGARCGFKAVFSSAPLLLEGGGLQVRVSCCSSARLGEGLGLLPALCLLVADTCWSPRWAPAGGSHSVERGEAQGGTVVPRRPWAGVGRAWVCVPLGVWCSLWLSCPPPALVQRDASLCLLAVPSERVRITAGRPAGSGPSQHHLRGASVRSVCRFKALSVMSSGAASL